MRMIAPALAAIALASASAACAGTDVSQAPAAEPSLLGPATVGLGGSAWSGDYGAQTDTTIAAVLLTARYKIGGLRLSASLPWMRIESQGQVFAGVDGTPLVVAGTRTAVKSVREGFGDITLGASYLLPTPPSWGLDIDSFARIKTPTAGGSTGLSTGRADFSGGVEVSKPIGRWAPFISVSYRDFGHTAAIPLKGGFATSVGTAYVLANRMTALLSYDYAERSSRFVKDSNDLSLSLSTLLPGSKLRLTSFVAGGLSPGAADISGGLSLSLNL